MKLIHYFVDNINKYYEYLNHHLINNVSNFKLDECPHIHLYGIEGSMINYYIYYIVNKLTNTEFKYDTLKLQQYNINVNNNNVDFNVKITNTFQELNLLYRSNYDKHIITKYIVDIIKNKNYKYDKHIIILKEFDKLNFNAYMAIRRIMEVYSENVLFICTSSNLSKIPEALTSRFLNIRCPFIEKTNLSNFIKIFLKDLNINNYTKADINKLIKNCENNIFKIILKLDADNFIALNTTNDDDGNLNVITDGLSENMDINNDPIKYKDILNEAIKKHLSYLKKTKKQELVLQKNREFIYKITYFNYSSQEILEKFVKIILKYFNKYLDCSKIIQITTETDNNIIKSNRDIYHFELYLLKIYKMFYNI